MEGLPGLHGKNPVNSPAILQLLQAAAEFGKVINEIPSEAVANVEIRIASIRTEVGAIGRLCCIWDIIFAVAGVVNRVRPCVIQRRSETMPAIDSPTGL